nr:hypothetical transcript [Hymenolepis microstoma]
MRRHVSKRFLTFVIGQCYNADISSYSLLSAFRSKDVDNCTTLSLLEFLYERNATNVSSIHRFHLYVDDSMPI